jgi:putative solute:sodium symporter small subunit
MNEDTHTDRARHSTDERAPVRADGGSAEAEGSRSETDGGTATGTQATDAAQDHRDTNYLDSEVNLLRPSTPFMRDHLRLVWTGFVAWAIIVFGPVTLTAIAPGVMTTQMPVIGFPLHYFLVAFGGPTGALLLALWYARRRDALDTKYGIEHTTTENRTGSSEDSEEPEETAVTDGGVCE